MNRNRLLLIFILLITLALGGAAIFIGYRLSQEEEVTPDEAAASPGDADCGGFVAHCVNGYCNLTADIHFSNCNYTTDCCTVTQGGSCAGSNIYSYVCLGGLTNNRCLENGPVYQGPASLGGTICANSFVGLGGGDTDFWIQVDVDFGQAQVTTTYQTPTYQTTTYQTTTQGTTSQRTTTQGTTSQRTTTQGTTTQATTTNATTTQGTTTNATTTNATTTNATTTNATTTGATTSTTTLPATGIFDSFEQQTRLAFLLVATGIGLYFTQISEKIVAKFSTKKEASFEKRILEKADKAK